MSNSKMLSARGSASEPQPRAARRASVSRSMTSSKSPVRSRTRSTNAAPFSAARQAWVAMSRARETPRALIFSRQTSRASSVRSIAGSQMRCDAPMPSPSRTMREKASTMRRYRSCGASAARAARSAADNYWCRDRARHRHDRRAARSAGRGRFAHVSASRRRTGGPDRSIRRRTRASRRLRAAPRRRPEPRPNVPVFSTRLPTGLFPLRRRAAGLCSEQRLSWPIAGSVARPAGMPRSAFLEA